MTAINSVPMSILKSEFHVSETTPAYGTFRREQAVHPFVEKDAWAMEG